MTIIRKKHHDTICYLLFPQVNGFEIESFSTGTGKYLQKSHWHQFHWKCIINSFFWMSHWTLGGGPSWFGWMTIDFRQRLMIQSLVHFPVSISQGPNISQGHVQPSKNWVIYCGPLHLRGCYVPYSLSYVICPVHNHASAQIIDWL